jgi:hypothetical protein
MGPASWPILRRKLQESERALSRQTLNRGLTFRIYSVTRKWDPERSQGS